jgi:hypothetical protein
MSGPWYHPGMMAVTSPADLLQQMPPFQERASYEAVHRCLALTDKDEVVRIVDWVKNHPEHGHRVLEVALQAPGSSANGLGWQIDEVRLTPIKKVEGALEQAQAWRALLQARNLAQKTAPALPSMHRSRL